MIRFIAGLIIVIIANSAVGQVPELAKLKRAAESGDPEAQYQYAQKCSAGGERRTWLLQAANQGHGTAQDQLAWELNWSLFATYFPTDPLRSSHLRSKSAQMRDALAWAALAADKGFGQSRLLLALAYANGYMVQTDLVEAYKWFLLSDRSSIAAGITRGQLKDRLLKTMPIEAVQAGERRAASYQPGQTASTIYRQLFLPLLKLNGTATMNGQTVSIINGKPAKPGEQVELSIEGTTIRLRVVRADKNSATVTLPPNREEIVLRTGGAVLSP
jgi:hypothetical protein